MLFRNYLPLKKGGAFTQGCFVPSLVEMGSVVLEKKIFLISSMYCHYFVIISPWKRDRPFIEKTWIHFTQGCFVPSLVEMVPVVLDKKICFNFVNVFSLFLNYLSLNMYMCEAFHLNKLESTSPKDALCQVLLILAPWFWRREDENVKSLQTGGRTTDGRQTDRQTDDGRQVIRKAHLNFQVSWT